MISYVGLHKKRMESVGYNALHFITKKMRAGQREEELEDSLANSVYVWTEEKTAHP
jgi:hypothetical protein